MAIYYCPQCNKKYFFDGEPTEFEKEFKCEMCGYPSTPKTHTNTIDSTTISDSEIQTEQLKSLRNIERMMKLFYYTALIGIGLYVLAFFIELGNKL